MKRKLRILHIITGLGQGGAESMLRKLVMHTGPGTSHEVISLTNVGLVGEQIRQTGIRVTALEGSGLRSLPSSLVRLASIIRRAQPDVIQTWMYHANIVGGLAARMAGNRAVVWNIRASGLDPSEKRSTKLIAAQGGRLASLLCRRIIANSSAGVEEHSRQGYPRRLFTIIPNGFDLGQFKRDSTGGRQLRVELEIPTSACVVGTIGRFHPVKDHAAFFRAARMLTDRRPESHFILAGDGIDQANGALNAIIAREGLLENTHLLGPRSDLPRILSAMDVFALSSAPGEGFPNVIGEAMACEVPCVATASGDSSHVIGTTGRVVPTGDAKALADACESILALAETERRAVGAQARARIAAHFSIDVIAAQYVALYEEVSSSHA